MKRACQMFRHLPAATAHTFIRALMIILLGVQLGYAISPEMLDLVTSETQFDNAYFLKEEMSIHDKKPIQLEHFEIPLSLLGMDHAEGRSADFLNSLVFKKNGKLYVRWVIQPEDTRFHKEIENWLRENKVSPQRKKYFTGYKTASRSILVIDKKTGFEFSLKTSTDTLFNLKTAKAQLWDESQENRLIVDFVSEKFKERPPKNFILLDEPLAFGIQMKNYGLGLIVRSYSSLTNSKHRYIPGFAIMNSILGTKLAKRNGASDPAAFWNEHYNKPLARALAELFVKTGVIPNAAHSQNFLVELDKKDRPTGKIILRDIGDSKLVVPFFKAIGREDILKVWAEESLLKEYARVVVGVLEHIHVPNWLQRTGESPGNPKFYETWGVDFFQTFDAEVKRITGLSLARSKEPLMRMKDMFKIDYVLIGPRAKEFFRQIEKNQNSLSAGKCTDLF